MEHVLQVSILKELMSQLDEGKNVDAGVQYKMSTQDYFCPKHAALEWENLFRNHPQLIGLSGDLPEPGSYFTMDDLGTPILATRDKAGTYHAFINACRHRSAKVALETRGKRSAFMCRYHNWSYRNNGDLINIPDEDHFGVIDKSCHGLIGLPAVERDGFLWVHPNPDGHLDVEGLLGEQLATELASYNIGNMSFRADGTLDMQLNWKFANDTFGETYHFAKLHKDTLARLYYGNNLHYHEFGRHHRFVTASRAIDALRERPESDWCVHHGAGVQYHVFPNIQIQPATNNVTLIRIYPDRVNPGRSITRFSIYSTDDVAERAATQPDVDAEKVYGSESVAAIQSTLEIVKSTVEKEDYLMGEMQQIAAESGHLKEVVFGRNEPALHHFHNNYREALGQEPLERVV